MKLEQITQKEHKPSLLQRIRNSTTNKFVSLFALGTFAFAGCGSSQQNSCKNDYDCPGQELCIDNYCVGDECNTDFDCPGDELCENNVCVSTSQPNSAMTIKSEKTNSQGQAFFVDQQTGENVTINVKDDYGNPVTNAPVAFFDGDGFEAFQVNHKDYAPALNVFAHNSSHTLSVTSNSMQFHHYDGNTNNNSKTAAKKYFNKMKSTSVPKGCEFADEIAEDFKGRAVGLAKVCDPFDPTNACDKFTNWSYKGLDLIYNIVDKLEEYGVISPGCIAYRTFANEDVSDWNIGPSLSLRIYECMDSIPAENCYNGIDDDCDHKIDFQDHDCDSTVTCQDECDNKYEIKCIGDEVFDCLNSDNDDCLEWTLSYSCGSDQKCENAACVPKETGCSSDEYECDDDLNLECIPKYQLCDGVENCFYGDDEDNCSPTCNDECSPSGKKECVGNAWKKCGDYDSDNCLEWKIQSCNDDDICNDGICENKPQSQELFFYDFGHYGGNGAPEKLNTYWIIFANEGIINHYNSYISIKPKTSSYIETKEKFWCGGEAILEFNAYSTDSKITITPSCTTNNPCKLNGQPIKISCEKISNFGYCNISEVQLICTD